MAIGDPVAATDTASGKTGDSATLTYGLAGTDDSSFTIDSTSGQIFTSAALNYSAKNVYSVAVTVHDGADRNGGVDPSEDARINVTITVLDLDEAPGAPAAPTVTAVSSTSLTASWSAPDNTGPPITDYNLRYRVANNGSAFTDAAHSGDSATATLSDLFTTTQYDVQVQAVNDEGTGAWSPSGQGTTGLIPLEVAYEFDSYETVENGLVAVRVQLDEQANRQIEVPISVTPGSNTNTGDYTIDGLSNDRLTFEVGTIEKVFTVSANQDLDSDDEQVNLAIDEDGLPGGVTAATPSLATLNIHEPPTVEITSAAPAPVTEAFTVTITFSEDVTGFEVGEIEVDNGAASDLNPTAGPASTYTVTITPTATADVTVAVPAGVAEDTEGNNNQAAETFTIAAQVAVGAQAPTVSFKEATYEATEGDRDGVTITVMLSKAADEELTIPLTSDPASGDFRLSATEVVFAASDTSQAFTVTATEDDDDDNETVILSFGDPLPDGVNTGTQATTTVRLVDNDKDRTRPRVEIETEATAPVTGPFEVTVRFSESVTGFTLTDMGVSNGTASNFKRVSSRTYRATITPEETGEVRVEVPARVAEDRAGNPNRAAEPLVIEADLKGPDLTGPEVEITSAAAGPVVNGTFEITITFDEPVEGFELEDVEVSNGTASNFTSVSAQEYRATITPKETGEVRVEVPAGVATDGAGNPNQAAEPFTIEADLGPPEVTIEGPTEPVGMEGFEVTITFSEPVTGFERDDIQVSNGTVADFTEMSSSEYQATIKPTEVGQPVVVVVPEDVAEDGAGNPNRAAEPFEVETKRVVSYQEESYTATEGGEAVTVTVKLGQGWDQELVIPIRVTRPEATEAADYAVEGLEAWDAQQGTGGLSFPAEGTEQTFTIAAHHDRDGDDETVELGFGELPEAVMAGEPAVATVTLKDKGLVELEVSFAQAEYQVMEGQRADIEMKVTPTADRRVEVPLVVAPQGGATDEDYRGVPAKVVFKEGESQGTISVEVLADEVNDPGEAIVLSFGELPEAVSAGDPSSTQVEFRQHRTAEQFSQTLEVALAVMARTMAESAQTAIEGRFERHRQWSRLEAAGGAAPTAQPGSDNSTTGLGPGERLVGRAGIDGSVDRGEEGSVKPDTWDAAQTRPATGPSGNSQDWQRGSTQGSWLRSFTPGGLASMTRSGQVRSGFTPGHGMGPSGSGYGQDRFGGSGIGDSSLRQDSTEFSGMRNQEFSLAGASFEMSLGGQKNQNNPKSWVPTLWGQGDLQYFNGNLSRIGMNYRGGLEAAHVGLDLYANDQVLTGLSFMRSWGNMDYTDDGVDGVLDSGMNTFHPYLYWQPHRRFSAWVIGGFGSGGVDVREPGRSHDFEADFRMFSGGVRTVLSRRGSNEVGLRADAFTAQLGTEASDDIAKVRGEAHRARLMLEWVHTKQLSAGRSLNLKVEVGGRHDQGDADRGSGVETGFRLGYLDANSGFDLALMGRTLVVHESDYRDWGLGVQASWDPGEKQRGFRVSVTSSRGQDGQGRTTLWNNAHTVTRPMGMGAMGMGSQTRMESEVAYGGLRVPGLRSPLTPYSRLRWTGYGRELAWGAAWSPARSPLALPLMFEMEAMRRETRTGPADHGVMVRLSIPLGGSGDVIPGPTRFSAPVVRPARRTTPTNSHGASQSR